MKGAEREKRKSERKRKRKKKTGPKNFFPKRRGTETRDKRHKTHAIVEGDKQGKKREKGNLTAIRNGKENKLITAAAP